MSWYRVVEMDYRVIPVLLRNVGLYRLLQFFLFIHGGRVVSGQCTRLQRLQLFADADKTLLKQVLANPNHTLHQFLPPINSHDHHLRKRPHNHQLPAKRTILQQSNFIIRSLFRDTY